MDVKIKLKSSLSKIPLKANKHAACYDVFAHSINVINNRKVEVGLGFMTEIPKGWKGVILARSSLAKTNWIVSNSIGCIDSKLK